MAGDLRANQAATKLTAALDRATAAFASVDAAAADIVAELLEGGAADLADLAGTSR